MWRIWADGERRPNLILKNKTTDHYTLSYGPLPVAEFGEPVTPSAICGLFGDPTKDEG